MTEIGGGGPDAKLADQKDALDVAIAHERAELDRLQRRWDRADAQATAITAITSAVAALAASVLAAVHRHIGVAAIVFTIIGGVCVGAAVVVSFVGREPRFRGSGPWYMAPRFLGMARRIDRWLGQDEVDWTGFVERIEPLRAALNRLGVAAPNPSDNSDRRAVMAFLQRLVDDVRKLQEDRLLAPIQLDDVSALDLRRNIASTLAVRIVFLGQLTEWRERLGRVSLVLVALAVPMLTAAVVVTVA